MSKYWIVGTGLAGLGVAAILAGFAVYTRMDMPAAAAVVALPRDYAEDLSRVVPHKALYKIEMVEKRSSAQILNISGEMYFQWLPACEAWTTDHRFNLLYEYAESSPMRITSDFSTYEDFAGTSFDFNSRRRRDGELYEELRGHAEPGRADFSLPAGLRFDLPEGAMFPIQHTLALMDAARSGQSFLNATIFDGSDNEGPTEVNAFIGAPVDAAARVTASASIDAGLLQAPARPVRLAFFPLAQNEAGSDYEMDIVLHDNGVISDMHVDYQDFSVTQKLVALERIAAPDCAGAP